jgi:hypothetical protein
MSGPVARQLESTATPPTGMSARTAMRLEHAIIGLGVFALALIFQPFSLSLFGVGCALVVVAGLINNLLPLCKQGAPMRSLAIAGLVVVDIFCVMLLASIAAAHLYGVLFVNATAPDAADPFYAQPFVWGVAVVAALLAAAIWTLGARTSIENQVRRKHSRG